MARVVVLGSSNTDMTVRLPRLPAPGETLLGGTFATGPGGKGANQAVAARRAGAEVVFLTAVGADALGRDALDRYRAEGVDVSHAKVLPGVASGVALIFVGAGGENMIGVAPGANARLTPEDIDALPDSVFGAGGVFLASLEVPLETVERALRRAKGAGMTTVLNPAPVDLRLMAHVEPDEHGNPVSRGGLLHFVDVLTPNQSEALALTGQFLDSPSEARGAAEELRAIFSIRQVIVTRGAKGSLLVEATKAWEIPPDPVEAVDTVGAGDAFNGALAAALAEGRPCLDAAAWASLAAALAVTRPGAQEGLPTRAEIEQRAARHAPRPVLFDEYFGT